MSVLCVGTSQSCSFCSRCSSWHIQRPLAFSLTSHVSQLRSWAAALSAFASRPGCAPYTILYTVKYSQAAWRPIVQHWIAGPFPAPPQRSRGLVFERMAKQQLYVTNSHPREKESKQAGRVRRKYNIWRLPAAAQWSGIKKPCYLNCKQFFSLHQAARKSAAGSQSFELIIKSPKLLSQLSRPLILFRAADTHPLWYFYT